MNQVDCKQPCRPARPLFLQRGETHALDAALLALAARELKQTLLDAKIDKIFEPTRDEVVITLRTRTDTFKLLLSARSGSARACLTQDTFENPAVPPSFCMLLRKHLTGGRWWICGWSRGTGWPSLNSSAPTRWAIWFATFWRWS